MGQRLVITCEYKDETIAAIYYHWSAYSMSAIYEVIQLRDYLEQCYSYDEFLNKTIPTKDLQLALLRAVESRGGGLDGTTREANYFKTNFSNETHEEKADRNEGLIAFSPEGIVEIQGYAEGDITIRLDELTVYDYVYWTWENISAYSDYLIQELEADDNDVYIPKETVIDPTLFEITEAENVLEFIGTIDEAVELEDGRILSLIG